MKIPPRLKIFCQICQKPLPWRKNGEGVEIEPCGCDSQQHKIREGKDLLVAVCGNCDDYHCGTCERKGIRAAVERAFITEEPQDIRKILGTWPGNDNDGFEQSIDDHRHQK